PSTDRYPHRAVLVLLDPERGREAGGDAVSGHDHRRVELGLFRVPDPAPVGVHRLRAHPDDPLGAFVQDRAGDHHAFAQFRAGFPGLERELLIEFVPRGGGAVARVALDLGPREIVLAPAAVHAQALVAVPAVLLADLDPHPDDLGHGARGQPVPADLVPGEGRPLEQQDLQAVVREVVRGRSATGPRAHDDDVRVALTRTSHTDHHFRYVTLA